MITTTKIDLNTASAEELESLEGIGPERARMLIQQRQASGTFRSWDEVKEAQGFTEALVERLRTKATLGSALSPEQPSSFEAGDSDMDLLDLAFEDDEESDDPEVDALVAIAQMDLETALAYEVAAALVSHDEIRDRLLEFGRRHRLHVEGFGQLIRTRGQELPIERGSAVSGMLANLSSAMGALGTRAALSALCSAAEFASQTYVTALSAVTDLEARAILDRHLGHAHEHLRWLHEQRGKLPGEVGPEADPHIARA